MDSYTIIIAVVIIAIILFFPTSGRRIYFDHDTEEIFKDIRTALHYSRGGVSQLNKTINDNFKLLLENKEKDLHDPYDKALAERAIKEFTIEHFKNLIDTRCIKNDKPHKIDWITDQILFNETLIEKYRPLGFGYTIQVRRHYIEVIKKVLEEYS